ncbi:MAG: hypothetical protein EOO56_27575 [Hymenobacter sp.]|nr:MAG: hypothetical protein EOO56_27575 [Hymenobacter sp.]
MKRLTYLLAVAGALGGCQKNTTEPSEDTAALHDRFHGQYSIVSATADRAVDLNRDGRASTDLLTEIPDLGLNQSRLLVLIRDNGLKWFEDSWPQPIIARNWNYSSPDSVMLNGYLYSPMPRDFTFDKNVTSLLVEPGPADKADGGRRAAPEKVTIEGDGQLRVVTLRLLYIGRSWQFVRIVTVYKRFTSTT